jgi:hypothetical protein
VNLSVCAVLPRQPENQTWYRAVTLFQLPTAFGSAHTANVRSRFNAGPLLFVPDRFETLYFTDDPTMAAYEIGAMLGQPWNTGTSIPHPKMTPYITVNADIILDQVVDLTEVANVQMPLATNAQELTGDWDCYAVRSAKTQVSAPTGIALTQDLGRELYITPGVEAFKTLSAKAPYHRNIVVFPKKLGARSKLTVTDPRDPTGPPLYSLP